MKVALLIITSILLAGIAMASVPSWVQPGMVTVYDGLSSSIQNGQTQNGVYTVITTQVDAVSNNEVSGNTKIDIPTAPLGGWSYSWIAHEGDSWKDVHRFWIDPIYPTASVKGPNGEIFKIIGSGPYPYGDRNWDATLMAYTNQDTGVEYHLTFETKTGLILAYIEKYPSLNTFIYFRSISPEL
jgi:hypothetical protein